MPTAKAVENTTTATEAVVAEAGTGYDHRGWEKWGDDCKSNCYLAPVGSGPQW